MPHSLWKTNSVHNMLSTYSPRFKTRGCMLYWNKGPHVMQNDTLGKPHDEIFTNLQSDRRDKAGT